MKPPYKLTESDVQKLILNWLKLRRYFHWRANTGGMSGAHKGKAWFVRFGRAGQPDIFVVRNGLLIGIEVKGVKGVQSTKQLEFQTELIRAGGQYILARNLEDVIREMP